MFLSTFHMLASDSLMTVYFWQDECSDVSPRFQLSTEVIVVACLHLTSLPKHRWRTGSGFVLKSSHYADVLPCSWLFQSIQATHQGFFLLRGQNCWPQWVKNTRKKILLHPPFVPACVATTLSNLPLAALLM